MQQEEKAERQKVGTAAGGEVFLDKFPIQSLDLRHGGEGGFLQKRCYLRLYSLLGLPVTAVDQIGIICIGKQVQQSHRTGIVQGKTVS